MPSKASSTSIPAQSAREGFVPLAEAARHLSVSTKSLRRMIAAQEIPAYRVGNKPGGVIRLKISEVEQVLYPMGSAS